MHLFLRHVTRPEGLINLIDEAELARLYSLVRAHPDGMNTIV
jgi:hypothetical protein